jgi:hypothetical protein
MYERVGDRLQALGRAQPLVPGWHMAHVESRARLGQCAFALTQFRRVETSAWSMRAADPYRTHIEPLRFYAEAFYYVSWRFRGIVRKFNVRRPTGQTHQPFKAFDPPGIRRARNQLIEHPEKPGGVAITHFTFDCPEGLILQTGATDQKTGELLDRGFYPNAEEFVLTLSSAIDRLT